MPGAPLGGGAAVCPLTGYKCVWVCMCVQGARAGLDVGGKQHLCSDGP